MKKSKRFKPVLRVAEACEKQAVSALGDAQKLLQSGTARLEELQDFQHQYRQLIQSAGEKGLDAKRMVEYQHFLDNLKLAIEQQKSIINVSRQTVEAKRQLWFESRNKLKSYGNVMDRFQTEEDKQQDRQEQRETDEHAGRSHQTKEND